MRSSLGSSLERPLRKLFRPDFRIALASLLSVLLVCETSRAQFVAPSDRSLTFGSEYHVGQHLGKPLISVSLLSGVAKPGLYHIPVGTNLAEVLTYAGGITDKASLNEVAIRRRLGSETKVIEINLEKNLRTMNEIPLIADGDLISIPLNQNMDRTMMWVSLISGIVSIGLSVAIIRDVSRK